MRIYKNALCLLYRSKILFITLILLSVFVGWQAASMYGNPVVSNPLGNTMTLSLYLFIIVMLVSFEYMKKFYNNGVAETVLVTKKGRKRRNFLAAVGVMTSYSFLVSIMLCGIVIKEFLFYKIEDPNNEYKIHIIKSVFLHDFLVMELAIVIGTTLANLAHRILAYVIMTIFILMSCPFASSIAHLITESCGEDWAPGRIAFKIISNFFIVPRFDTKYLPEAPYGESLMPDRLCMIGFWMFFFVTILCITRKRYKKFTVFFGAFAFVMIFSFHSPIARMHYGYDLFYGGDPDWILKEKYHNKEEAADYKITAYEMDLSLNISLFAKVNMKVSKSLDEYKMTLYNRYKVSKVTDQNGNKLKFTQDGNYLDIVNENGNQITNIILNYYGSDISHYANYQCCNLPGYFLYYPRAGYIPVYDETYGYVYYDFVNEDTEFRVRVDSPEKYISNLELIDGEFVGKCDGFTLVKGFYKKEDLGNGNTFVYPYLDNNIVHDGKASEQECWKEWFELSREELEKDSITNTMLFYDNSISMDQGCACGKNQFFIDSYPAFYVSSMRQ